MKKSAASSLLQRGRILARLIRRAVWRFFSDGGSSHAAAIAYYAVFSLPALLLLIIRLVGFWLGDERVRDSVVAWIGYRVGPQAAEFLRELIIAETDRVSVANLAAIVGLAALLFSATTVFTQVQSALNRVWRVEEGDEEPILRSFAIRRLLSFVVLLGSGVLLLLSMTARVILAAIGSLLGEGAITSGGLMIADAVLSTLVTAVLFTGIFRAVPAVHVAWKDAWAGGLFTAALFTVGNRGVAIYFHFIPVGGVYGSAGSLALILFWFYFTAMVLLLGAEFTLLYARQRGRAIRRRLDDR